MSTSMSVCWAALLLGGAGQAGGCPSVLMTKEVQVLLSGCCLMTKAAPALLPGSCAAEGEGREGAGTWRVCQGREGVSGKGGALL